LDRARQDIITALEAGDEARLRGLVFSLYLGGHTAVDICDLLLAPAFQELGARWQHGALEVYEERRGCEICLRVLYQLRQSLPTIPAEAPRAIGATLEGDPYMLPTAMVAIALREAGWNAESYGCWHPPETLEAAVREERPRLLWISVSTLDDGEAFVARYTSLYHSAVASGVAVAVGGRALTEHLRRRIEYSAYGDCLRHLVAFVATLRA
jgi:methanogenic corrinoid protein MtbC1